MQICEIVATAATIETEFMTRLAVVTGGTRGIGAAVSIELKKRGYAVAATYAGNDERANAFSQDTGIAVFKFDVSDFDACKAGVAKITEQLGQEVDVLVNNAGITRDGTMHRMTPENWKAVLDTNLGGCYNMCATVIDGMPQEDHLAHPRGPLGQGRGHRAKRGFPGGRRCRLHHRLYLVGEWWAAHVLRQRLSR